MAPICPPLRHAAHLIGASALAWSQKTELRRQLGEGEPLLALLEAKRSLLAQEASDAQLAALDEAMEALLLNPGPEPSLGAASAELFALLPAPLIRSCAHAWRGENPEPSPLHWLCKNIGARELAPSAQADFFAPSQSGSLQASLLACARARPEWIHHADEAGNTPLHWAVYFLAIEAIEPLLALGANPHARNALGSPAFDPDFFRLYTERSAPPPLAQSRSEALLRLMERQCLSDATQQARSEGESGGKRL